MMESRREEQLRRREQARAHPASQTPEQRKERLKRLDVLVRHQHQKRGKPGCHRWELTEEDVLVKHMKRGKPICSRHQMTGGTRGRLDLSMKYLIKTLRLKMAQLKFHADLASIDNTMNSAGSRRRYVRQ